jgi:CubicO group peptidase (beta-lactamase class C family)
LVAVGAAMSGACARPADSMSARIDEIFAERNRQDAPGCGVGISRNGVPVYERGYGMANLELDVPITPASVFEAASISKQFTAMSIMLLAERGQLSLDDPVRKHLPELPDYGHPLTIRHLLNHTSGLRDVFLLLEVSAPQDDNGDRNGLLLELLIRQRALNFQPGTEAQYNNGGYVLLAVIVRRVSGQSLGDFARANIFNPLGMTSTRFQEDPAVILPDRASNYVRDDGHWRFVPFSTARGAVGNSGLWTTTSDLLRWTQNLADPRVGSAALLAEMQKPTEIGGKPTSFGLGFEIREHRGSPFVGHGGGDRGIDNYVAWYPQQRLAIAVLCNTDITGSQQLTRRIADLYIGGAAASPAAESPAPVAPAVKLSTEQLQRNVGLYRESGGETFFRAFVREGQLMGALGTGTGDYFPLTPASETRFTILGTPFSIEFAPPVSGLAPGFRNFIEEKPSGAFERVQPFTPSIEQLRTYAGAYRSAELAVEWTIAVRDTALVIRRPGKADTTVEPLATDMFTTIGDFMKFSRDPRGAIDGLTVVSSGARGLRFERVNQ